MNGGRPRAHLASAFRVAAAGIARSVRDQRNLRIHLVLAIVALGVALTLRVRVPYALGVVGAIGLVLVAELLNSAVESAVDLAMPRSHPLARDAKDAAAGAVLVAAGVALALGVLSLAGALSAGPAPAGPAAAATTATEALLALSCAAMLAAGWRAGR